MPVPAPFKIERYFAQHEFTAPHLLSASDCDGPTLAELLELADDDARQRWDALRLAYTESAGLPALREAVAAMHPGTGPDDVLIVSPIEGILLAMQALLAPGDQVVVMFPAYQALYEVARAAGITVRLWPLELRAGRWHADPDRLASLVGARTRMLVVNAPHNPTGFLPTAAEFDAIIGLAERHGLLLFSDEMYRGLEPDQALRLPPATSRYDGAITLGGLSKSYGLPGVRLGWLVSRRADAIRRCQSAKDYTSICHPAPSEVLALIAVRAGETLLARNRALVARNVRHAAEVLGASSRFEWVAPQGGSTAFPRWTGPGPVEALADRAVRDAGVMVVSGELFDVPGEHFRVGLGRARFPEALDRFAAVAALD